MALTLLSMTNQMREAREGPAELLLTAKMVLPCLQ